MPKPVEFTNDFLTRFGISRYQYYGYRERKFRNELTHRYRRNMNFDLIEETSVDSSVVNFNQTLDTRPDSVKVPLISSYKTKFLLDWLWGGMSYSPLQEPLPGCNWAFLISWAITPSPWIWASPASWNTPT